MPMKTTIVGAAVLALLWGAGCQKQTPEVGVPAAAPVEPKKPGFVELVPEAEQSAHFAAVSRQLELGGTLYGYADIDGDALKLAASLRQFADRLAVAQPATAKFVQQNYAQLFTQLGLTDIKALGFSSVPAAGGGFRNRAFFYMPGGRRGLMAGFGGPASSFKYVKLAPADTDFYSETEIDLPVVYAAIKAIVAKAGGDAAANALEASLRQAGAQAGFSVYDFIQGYKGRTTVILRFDPIRSLHLPPPSTVVLPAFSLLLRIDGVGPAVEPALARLPLMSPSREGNVRLYTLRMPVPLEGLRPVFAVQGTVLYVATTHEFLIECHQRLQGLDQEPAFQQALAAVGREGNGLTYLTPRFFKRLHQLPALNRGAPPNVKDVLNVIDGQLPLLDRPLISVRSNQPDGILVRSYWSHSLKQDLVMTAGYNPITLGLMSAMAIPAFQKVRASSQEKAIRNNLRQLGAAADQYYLEHGVATAAYDQLVGPDKYIKVLVAVAGEDYRLLEFRAGVPLSVHTADGRVIEYKP